MLDYDNEYGGGTHSEASWFPINHPIPEDGKVSAVRLKDGKVAQVRLGKYGFVDANSHVIYPKSEILFYCVAKSVFVRLKAVQKN